MAFGLKYVQKTEKEQLERNREGLREDDALEQTQKQVQERERYAASRFRRPNQDLKKNNDDLGSSADRSQTRLAPAPIKNVTNDSTVQQIQQEAKPPSFRDLWKDAREMRQDEEEAGQDQIASSSAPAGLDDLRKIHEGLRARRIIQEIAEARKWSLSETEQLSREAMRNPSDIMKKWKDVYQKEVLAVKKQFMQNLKDSHESQDGLVLFASCKNGERKKHTIRCLSGDSSVLLQGSLMESVSLDLIPFKEKKWPSSPKGNDAPRSKDPSDKDVEKSASENTQESGTGLQFASITPRPLPMWKR